jgi:hypothetical protein
VHVGVGHHRGVSTTLSWRSAAEEQRSVRGVKVGVVAALLDALVLCWNLRGA